MCPDRRCVLQVQELPNLLFSYSKLHFSNGCCDPLNLQDGRLHSWLQVLLEDETMLNKSVDKHNMFPSKIEWDLTNGPLSKLLELLDTQVWGVRSVGPVGDFLECWHFFINICLKNMLIYFGCCPLPATVTTRTVAFFVGDSYKPSFATVTGRGPTQDILI